MNKRSFGGQGEADARACLVGKGIKILEMNFRRPTGEIRQIEGAFDATGFW